MTGYAIRIATNKEQKRAKGKLCTGCLPPFDLVVLCLSGGTLAETGTPGTDETGLLTGWRRTADGRGVTNVLVVTTTVWVVHRVHGNTTGSWPRVALDAELVVGTTSLEQRLVDTATSSDDADSGTGSG